MVSLFTIRKRKAQQKFNIASIGTLAIALLVVAVILGLNTTILEKIKKTADDNSATIGANESFGWPGNNTITEYTGQTGVILGSVVVYSNVTLLVAGVNLTVNTTGVYILNQTAVASSNSFNLLLYNMTYDYSIGSNTRNITTFGIDGQTQLVQFVPTIAIVAMAAIVIGIILVFFGRRKEDEAR